MTAVDYASPARTMSHADDTPRVAPALVVALAFAVSAALCWPQVVGIWTTGTFHDTDDAMRMVQVRDWLAGQGWYDLRAWRLDPPDGASMHWSRLVDLPLAGLMLAFSVFARPATAELLTRIAFPLACQLALLAALVWTGRILAGPRAAAPAATLAVLSGFMFGQFVPGRVDHHAPQIVLLVLMTGSLLAALDPARARMAALSALCAGLSLTISVENLPFIAIVCVAVPIAWVVIGSPMRPVLVAFAAGLVSFPLLFALFNAPSHWLGVAYDAFSIIHVTAGLLAALGCLALAALDRPDSTPNQRLLAAALAGGGIAGVVLMLFPGSVGDPFVGLDPLVRRLWLDHNTEVRTLPTFLALYPAAGPLLVLPPVLGLAGLLAAAGLGHGLARGRAMIVAALVLAGMPLAFLAMRASTSLAPLALLGGVCIATRVSGQLARPAAAACASLLVCLPFSTLGWAVVSPVSDNAAEDARLLGGALCREASAYAPLAQLPPGRVLAVMDAGAHLLAHTPHTVFGAPYHRNNDGNRFVLDSFLASPDTAQRLVRERGVRYVAICPGQVQADILAQEAPGGLAARLLRGEVPDWLAPIPLSDTPFRVFAMLPRAN